MSNALPKPTSDARSRRKDVTGQGVHRLPVQGRIGRPPAPPFPLGPAGRRWWKWVWASPQAILFHKGFHEPLARRASMEDLYNEALGHGDATEAPRLLALMMRLDDAFGLTPAGAAKQHMVFVDEPTKPEPVKGPGASVTPMRNRLKGMRD